MHRIIVTGKNKELTPALRGISRTQQFENRNSRAVDCLSARGEGRPVVFTVSTTGRPTTSGMTTAARATGDLSRSEGQITHTVKRSFSGPSALHSPAATPAPKKPRGTLLDTVQEIATFATACVVFGGLAFFFLILA